MARSTSGGSAGRIGVGLAVGAFVGFIALDLDLPTLVSFWGDRSFLVPALAVACALAWLTPLRRLVALAGGILGIVWLAVAFTPLVSWMAGGLVRRDPPADADAVYVFASRLQADGDPTTDAMSRLLKGIELLAQGRAKRLVVPELPPPSRLYAPLARDWVKLYAPGTEVLSVGPTSRTREEAVALARLFRERGWRRVLAVTSPTHTRRACASLEQQGLSVVSVPAIETDFDLETLDRPGDRRSAFGPVAHERLGLFVYRRRGWM